MWNKTSRSSRLAGGSVVKNPPANAGNMIPGTGRCHMLQSNSTCKYWSLYPEAHAPQVKPQQWEASALQQGSSPSSPQLEKALVAMKTQSSQKETIFFFKVEMP